MEQQDFEKTWQVLNAERNDLVNQRNDLEMDLIEVRNKLAHLSEVLDHLAPMAGMSSPDEITSLGITDAIRMVLQSSTERMSPQDVRKTLADSSYDLSGLTSPMASIYKILSRLADESGEAVREREDGRVYYKWKSSPITDEDIPF